LKRTAVAADARPSPPAEPLTDTLLPAVSPRHHIRFRRSAPVLGAVVLALSLSACGHKVAHPRVGQIDGTASSGFYVDAGKITYQVQISRELNPYDNEDKTYLDGVADQSLTPSQEWLGVFLWAKNQSKVNATTSDDITITDTLGNVYHPTVINTAENQLAWTAQLLRPQQTEPMEDTPASYDLTQGAELLFKVNDSIYANRPLTLNIYAQGQKKPAQVSLDL
jgi:hypothetical protein